MSQLSSNIDNPASAGCQTSLSAVIIIEDIVLIPTLSEWGAFLLFLSLNILVMIKLRMNKKRASIETILRSI